MNCTKNPHLKRRAEVDLFDRLMTVNAVHFCRLIYVLMSDPGASFYPKRARAYIESYCEYVRYVQEDNDKEIRRYRFNEMLRDAPYISYSRADNILTCQEGFADSTDKPLYIERRLRSDLIDNIILALIVLHYEFGFGEERIARLCTAWASCGYAPAVEWAEKRLDVHVLGNTKQDVYDWLKASAPKKQRVTLAEQKDAKAGLEALRKYQQEVRNGKAQHI